MFGFCVMLRSIFMKLPTIVYMHVVSCPCRIAFYLVRVYTCYWKIFRGITFWTHCMKNIWSRLTCGGLCAYVESHAFATEVNSACWVWNEQGCSRVEQVADSVRIIVNHRGVSDIGEAYAEGISLTCYLTALHRRHPVAQLSLVEVIRYVTRYSVKTLQTWTYVCNDIYHCVSLSK